MKIVKSNFLTPRRACLILFVGHPFFSRQQQALVQIELQLPDKYNELFFSCRKVKKKTEEFLFTFQNKFAPFPLELHEIIYLILMMRLLHHKLFVKVFKKWMITLRGGGEFS